MSKSKSVSIKSLKSMRKDNSTIIEKIADEWVGGAIKSQNNFQQSKTQQNLEKTQLNTTTESRFTLVIPTYLHTRIKKHCAINAIPMKKLLTEILLKEFPER